MHLLTFTSDTGEPHVGVVREDHVIDLSLWFSMGGAYGPFTLLDLIRMGEEGLAGTGAALHTQDEALGAAGALVPLSVERLRAPIPRPRKNVFCLGRNYAEHAAESARAYRQEPPPEAKVEYPAVFTKATTSIIGPYDDIPYDPNISEEMDWEVELAVVIGRRGKNIRRDEALWYVFGYMVLNDISARDIQKRHGGQFFKGKSLDGSCPTGPWIVTPDELGDPNQLELWTRINGVEKQHDNTRSMLLDVPGTIEMLSWGMTLEPGDIIATGTPAGVGFARTPPEYLRPGDVVECEIENIGLIRNTVREA
jgi:2-keto-4-pentenoate hydratase/2-oxohepta-3-ene-1,7-dioic acid hydratase in catechol pathway